MIKSKLKNFPKVYFFFKNLYHLIIDPIFLLFNIRATKVEKDIILAKSIKNGLNYHFPYQSYFQLNHIQMKILNRGFHFFLQKQYSTNQCKVEKGDIVIDCGGFVGGFSIAASLMGAKKIFYIEPTPLSRKCAKKNFELYHCQNIEILGFGLGEKNKKAFLNLSRSQADNSILEPDEGNINKSLEIDLFTLDHISEIFEINQNNTFLKIEAEGYEIEILKGMNSFYPKKIVIDISPERDGISPVEEVSKLLISKNYKITHISKMCCFAIRY